MGSVYLLTLRQLASRWRLLIMGVLAAMPVLIVLLMLHSDDAPGVDEFESVVLSGMLAGSIIPLVVLAIAAVAFGNEVEDKTLANLTLTPIPRWQIALPKLLAAMTISAPFILISAFATSHLAYLGDPAAVMAVTVSALVGVALYASAFVWLGLVSTQAVGVGLVYIVLWEGFLSGFVSGVRLFSIRQYAIAIMHGLDPRRFAEATHLGFPAASLLAGLMLVGFFTLAVRRLNRMDVP